MAICAQIGTIIVEPKIESADKLCDIFHTIRLSLSLIHFHSLAPVVVVFIEFVGFVSHAHVKCHRFYM